MLSGLLRFRVDTKTACVRVYRARDNGGVCEWIVDFKPMPFLKTVCTRYF